MPTRTSRIRPRLDALEPREVCWSGLPGMPLGGLSPIVHLGPMTPPAHQLHIADSVFTLANQTGHSLSFTVRWQGSSAIESYTLMLGESRQIWVREVERFPAARTAVIRVDGRQMFQVTAALSADDGNGPVSSGPVYTFQPGADGGVMFNRELGKMTAGIRV